MVNLQGFINTHAGHRVVTVLAVAFCLTQLSGCGVVSNSNRLFSSSYDGPPSVDVDVSKVRDAVPRVEPLHPYGTRDYVVGGRHYHVLKSSKGYIKRGYASWYGSKFHGNETSMQERFNLYAMTAASPELPLPSYVQVTNLQNGRQAIVRVNDRGPFHNNRILDLSYAAARKLGFAATGIASVKVVAIDPKTWGKNKVNIAQNQVNKSRIFLQLGAFAELDNAKKLSSEVNKILGNPIQIKHNSDLYRVQVGPLASIDQGDELKLLLEKHGFNHVTVIGG